MWRRWPRRWPRWGEGAGRSGERPDCPRAPFARPRETGRSIRFDIVTNRACVVPGGSAPNLGSIRQAQPRAPAPDRPLVLATGGGQAPERDYVRRGKVLRPRAGVVFRRRRGGRGPAGHQGHEPGSLPRGGALRAIPPERPATRGQDRRRPGIGSRQGGHRWVAQQRFPLRTARGGVRARPQPPAPRARQQRQAPAGNGGTNRCPAGWGAGFGSGIRPPATAWGRTARGGRRPAGRRRAWGSGRPDRRPSGRPPLGQAPPDLARRSARVSRRGARPARRGGR
jgi:hypothetical protein